MDPAEIEHRYRYFTLAHDLLVAPAALGHEWSVVDVYPIGNLDGDPFGMSTWLIFATNDEAERARSHEVELTARARQVLAAGAFPGDALPTVVVRFTSEVEIEDGGGRFGFFR